MRKGTIFAPTPWGGKPGGTTYGSQLEEWKATGLDCFTMLHISKVKQFSNMFSSFWIMSKGLPLCSFLFQTFPFAPIAHFHSWTCLATQTSLFWALGLLLGSLHKARDVEGCFAFSSLRFTKQSLPLWAVPCEIQVRFPLQDWQSVFLGGILFGPP